MNSPGLKVLASLEKEFADNKSRSFRGTVRVRLSQLAFPNPFRDIDPKIKAKLIRDFGKVGCLHHDRDYSLPATISSAVLTRYLKRLNVDAESFKSKSASHPSHYRVPNDIQLSCLHGQHRVIAAAEFLPSGDRWWLVDLYDDELDDSARQIFREGRSYSTNYTGGEIFRQIRLCQFEGNKVREQHWRAHLTSHKERDLDRLLKRSVLLHSLDSILPFRGLWGAFHLGSMDLFLDIQFDEEISNYIGLIGRTLMAILGGESSLIRYLDEPTVNYIQDRAPAVSQLDAAFIRNNSRHLFRGIKDSSVRETLKDNLLRIDTLIPSIQTMFRDLRYLEPAARAIAALLPPPTTLSIPSWAQKSLRQRLKFFFTKQPDDALDIQDSEEDYTTVDGAFDHLFDLAIRQLFLASLRYFTPPSDTPLKKNMDPITQRFNASKRFLGFRLIALGRQCGFDIGDVDNQDPAERLLGDMLATLPPNLYQIQTIPEPLLQSFKHFLADSAVVYESASVPCITTLHTREKSTDRRGQSYRQNEKGDPQVTDNWVGDNFHLFLRKMHQPLSSFNGPGYAISSFYKKRCIYTAFFGSTEIVQNPASRNGIDEEDIFSEYFAEGEQEERGDSSASNLREGSVESPVTHDEHRESSPRPAEREGDNRVRFVDIEGVLIVTVAFSKPVIDAQTKIYALEGCSLMDERGRYWPWDECYDALVADENRTLIVVRPEGKRRPGEEETSDRIKKARIN